MNTPSFESPEGFRSSSKKLAELNALMTRLQAGGGEKIVRHLAAHQIRNMLGVLRWSVEILDLEKPQDAQVKRHTTRANQTIDQMIAIVEMFLTPESSRTAGAAGAAPLTQVVRHTVEQFEAMAARKNIRLETGMVDPLVKLPLNVLWLIEALTNLVSNAIKYTPEGGAVAVRVRRAGLNVRFEVADTGPGVPVDERSRLFSEGGTTSVKPTGGEDSTGLGLFLVRLIAEAMGGQVGAEFPEAGGSCFFLEVPYAQAG